MRVAEIDIDGQHALLVADECHRYATERWVESLWRLLHYAITPPWYSFGTPLVYYAD